MESPSSTKVVYNNNTSAFSGFVKQQHMENHRQVTVAMDTKSTTKSGIQVARDPIQPRSGRISEVRHSDSIEEDEEADTITSTANMNNVVRSNSWKRKLKLKQRLRPLTPPPPGGKDIALGSANLRTPTPSCILENPNENIFSFPDT